MKHKKCVTEVAINPEEFKIITKAFTLHSVAAP